MARINLLPWRTTLRKERETRFAIHTAIALSITGMLFFGVYYYINVLIEYQKQRNELLNKEIKMAEKKIEEIKEIRKKHESLTKRIEIIHQLQTSRPDIVHLFNDFAKKMPTGVFYKRIVQTEDKIALEGIAQSSARVSSLMRQLDESPFFEKPNLGIIQTTSTAKDGSSKESEFKLTIQQEKSKAEKERLEKEKAEKERAEKAKAAAAAAATPPAAAPGPKK
jgi:type IV pilus assembly protein PilN